MTLRSSVSVFLCLGILLCGFAALSVSRADARVYSTSTSFGFYASPDAFLGQVASNSDRCRSGRLVKIFRNQPGRDRLIGRDRAGPTGQWEVEREVRPARYYALVPKIRFGPNGRHSCRAYRSTVLSFG